jgi:hypothetical protein
LLFLFLLFQALLDSHLELRSLSCIFDALLNLKESGEKLFCCNVLVGLIFCLITRSGCGDLGRWCRRRRRRELPWRHIQRFSEVPYIVEAAKVKLGWDYNDLDSLAQSYRISVTLIDTVASSPLANALMPDHWMIRPKSSGVSTGKTQSACISTGSPSPGSLITLHQ